MWFFENPTMNDSLFNLLNRDFNVFLKTCFQIRLWTKQYIPREAVSMLSSQAPDRARLTRWRNYHQQCRGEETEGGGAASYPAYLSTSPLRAQGDVHKKGDRPQRAGTAKYFLLPQQNHPRGLSFMHLIFFLNK